MFHKRRFQNNFKIAVGEIIILLFLFIGLPTILLAGIGNAQVPGAGTTNPSLQRQVTQQPVAATVERLLKLPPVKNEQWTITKDGRVSFSTIIGGGVIQEAKCQGNGIGFAKCVQKIVDKSGCAKVTTCKPGYCADPC